MMKIRSLRLSYATLLGALLFASAGTAIASAQQQPTSTAVPIMQSSITHSVMNSDLDDDIESPYQRAFERRQSERAMHLLLEVGP
ncbi:hypothetical protein EPN44_09165 [bacterium]|nr:MAG: hypothetical protein EPN44_09165 [bacterium]